MYDVLLLYTLLKKGVLKQHTFYVQKTTHLKVCYSSTPLGVLFACPENNTPLGVFWEKVCLLAHLGVFVSTPWCVC